MKKPPKKKPRRKPKANVVRVKDSSPEVQIVGAEERSLQCQRLAVELRSQSNLPVRRIAEEIAKRLNLEVIPNHATILRWLDKAKEGISQEIKIYSREIFERQAGDLEVMMADAMEIATDQTLVVERTITEGGRKMKVIDERAVDERLKAMQTYAKLATVQAKLLGINLADEKEKGE